MKLPSELIISVEGIEIKSYLGVYEEEKKIKNSFTIDVFVRVSNPQDYAKDDLAETIDYQQIYDIVLRKMEDVGNLLEAKAEAIIDAIYQLNQSISYIKLKIRKIKPLYMEKSAFAAVEMIRYF